MRTELDINCEDLFRKRLEEKERMREELFSAEYRHSKDAQEHFKRLNQDIPKRIKIGKPAFAPKF